jgi:hypothetical protein
MCGSGPFAGMRWESQTHIVRILCFRNRWVFIGGGRWCCGWACTADILWVWLVAAVVVVVPFVVAVRSVVVGSVLAVFLFLTGVAVLVRRVGRALRGGPVDVVGACPA